MITNNFIMTKKVNFDIHEVKDLVNARIEPAKQAQVRTIVLLAAVVYVAKLVTNFKTKKS